MTTPIRFALVILLVVLLACGRSVAFAQSLYRADTYQSLISDHKARHVGDVVTVLVYETSSATTKAGTDANRGGAIGVGVTVPSRGRSYEIKTNNDFEGGGKTERTGQILAQMTATITSININGDLVLSGEQLVEINNEKQRIRVEGRVRPQDVSESNTVLSSRLADSRISYVGQGEIADRQHPTWWQRFLTMFGL